MVNKKIGELPVSHELPNDDEFIMPIFIDKTDRVTKSISIDKLIERIRTGVTDGGEIEVITFSGGIKIRKIDK